MDRIQSEMTVSIGEAAEKLGVSVKTIRRWSDAGRLGCERTPSGHRRYYISDILRLSVKPEREERKTIVYGRVSSHDQKEDLVRQIEVLSQLCVAKGWGYEVIQDLGSGLNYKKKGLKKLLKLILTNQVERLVLTHKDRLLRFGSELVFAMCDEFQTEVVIINKTKEDSTFEAELVRDMIELVTVFSARLYGSRSRKNQKLVDNMVKSVQESLT
ncbi:IS607 family transposase [Rivularia sp. PCC 7116]|uniref:IS607 family transposase n=1 Tax=Rivularia sp. PCC 7116 TaxID=373994 RepID=UPI00030DEA7F|nr:IS607 family transposase [Rivularia sp. PCC 7116]